MILFSIIVWKVDEIVNEINVITWRWNPKSVLWDEVGHNFCFFCVCGSLVCGCFGLCLDVQPRHRVSVSQLPVFLLQQFCPYCFCLGFEHRYYCCSLCAALFLFELVLVFVCWSDDWCRLYMSSCNLYARLSSSVLCGESL